MDLEALWEEMAFEIGAIGGHLKDKKTFIGGGNHFTGDIMIIGDDPELFMDDELRVRNGSGGEFLLKLLEHLELTPEDYFVTTLSKSNYRFSTFVESDQELLWEYLKMQISLIKPKIILCFGADIAAGLLEREINFHKERGKILELAGDMKLLMTYSPGFAMKSRNEMGRGSQVANEFWADLKLLKKYEDESES